MVPAGAEVRVDGAAWHDNTHGDDNTHDDDNSDDDNSDARYDTHAHDRLLMDEVHQVATEDGAVRADVVAPVRMQINLPADKIMRICIFS